MYEEKDNTFMSHKITNEYLNNIMSSNLAFGGDIGRDIPMIDDETEEIIAVDIDSMIKMKEPNFSKEHLDRVEASWGDLPDHTSRRSKPITGEELQEYWKDFQDELESDLNWDKAAWYQAFHSYPNTWGIYIKQDALLKLSIRMSRFMPDQIKFSSSTTATLYKLAWLCFFYHEYFHHMVESFATWVEQVSYSPIYLDYNMKIYTPTIQSKKKKMQDLNIEEALANVNILRELTKNNFSFLDDTLLLSARRYILYSFGFSPGGYRQAKEYFSQGKTIRTKTNIFKKNINQLKSQIIEGKLEPSADRNIWDLHPIKIKPMVNSEKIPCWIVMPKNF